MATGESDRAAAHLGVFGKHPGWNDHIDDLGIDTDLLAAVKRVLYIEGIGGNIDSGAWDGLVERSRLEQYEHLWLWRMGGALVVGRMWSSRDGKGRAKYPMGVCAQLGLMPVNWVVLRVVPLLLDVENRCKQAATADQVRMIVGEGRERLAAIVGSSPPAPDEPMLPRGVLARIAGRDEMRPASRGLHCLLYQIQREVLPHLDGEPGKRVLSRPYHIRAPRCADTAGDAAGLWLAFAASQIGDAVPVLLVLPDGQGWVDIILGAPTPREVFCIKANLNAIGHSTEIPYNLDAEFLRKAGEMIARSAASGDDSPPVPPAEDKPGGLLRKLSARLGLRRP
ncbi:MAG: hypothetical protein ACE15C_14180 [Phycisphaerae bacterium]